VLANGLRLVFVAIVVVAIIAVVFLIATA